MKPKLRLILLVLLILLLLGWLVRCFRPGPETDRNLIVNGDAEAGLGSPDGAKVPAIPGWTPTGQFTVVRYDATGGFMGAGAPGPENRGRNYFTGGPGNPASSATQVIEVAGLAARIDARELTGFLSGYLGGYAAQNDHAVLTAEFQDAAGARLDALVIGPVSNTDRGGRDGLLLRQASGAVPAGTRRILLTLQMTRAEGEYNDGYADNLSLVLKAGAAR